MEFAIRGLIIPIATHELITIAIYGLMIPIAIHGLIITIAIYGLIIPVRLTDIVYVSSRQY